MSFILVLLGVVCFFFILSVVSSVGSWFETRKFNKEWEVVMATEGHPCRFCEYKMRYWKSYTGMDITYCSFFCKTYNNFISGKKSYNSESDLEGWDYFHEHR